EDEVTAQRACRIGSGAVPHGSPMRVPLVLPLVIGPELTALDGSPPGFVAAIPVDGPLERFGPGGARRPPAQFVAEARRVERVATIVAGAIGNAPDHRFVLTHQTKNRAGGLEVGAFVVAADVVHGAGAP